MTGPTGRSTVSAAGEPRTEAGRELIGRMTILFRAQHESVEEFTKDILAIEAEARSEASVSSVEALRIAFDAGREAASFEAALDRVNEVMGSDTTAIAAEYTSLSETPPEPPAHPDEE